MSTQRPKVFTWGTFDNLHDGHKEFLRRLSLLGRLYVIVIPSENKYENNGYYPEKDAPARKQELLFFGKIENNNLIEDVFIDSYSKGLRVLLEHNPDIFCFGYDQSAMWNQKLMDFCLQHNLKTTFIQVLNKNGDGTHTSAIRAIQNLDTVTPTHS
jgi:cytidyltransferase-like protein